MNYMDNCRTAGNDAIFANFLTDDPEKQYYDEITDLNKMRDFLNQKL